MKTFFIQRVLGALLLTMCSVMVLAAQHDSEPTWIATGGERIGSTLCPISPLDTIVPVSPSGEPGESNPDMSIDGLKQLIERKKIDSIGDLLHHLPIHYRTNFSLVEHTRATGQSNLQFPRIVLFGSDGRFMLNVGTKPDDPKYDLLDVAQLHENTGQWEFSMFDFSGQSPSLHRNDTSCTECHGTQNSRPIWGSNMEWTGVFGDNVAKGPQGEALDGRHLEQIRSIIRGDGQSPRFDFLQWGDAALHRGGKRRIARHAFGAELILSNIAMGSATARGAFLRLRAAQPTKYLRKREALLLSYYARRGHVPWSRVQATALGVPEASRPEQAMDLLLASLGLDTEEAFSLATLHLLEPPQRDWSMGRGDLYDLLALQILDELWREDEQVAQILSERRVREGVLGCPDTARNIADVVQFKMLHLFHLKGESRFLVHEQFYPLDLEDVYSRVFLPVAHPLLSYLSRRVAALR